MFKSHLLTFASFSSFWAEILDSKLPILRISWIFTHKTWKIENWTMTPEIPWNSLISIQNHQKSAPTTWKWPKTTRNNPKYSKIALNRPKIIQIPLKFHQIDPKSLKILSIPGDEPKMVRCIYYSPFCRAFPQYQIL